MGLNKEIPSTWENHLEEFKFKTIIFNANFHHVMKSDFQRLNIEEREHYIYGIMKNLKSFINFSFNPNAIDFPNEELILKKHTRYFNIDDVSLATYSDKLIKLIDLSKSIGENTIIYITSHAYSGVIYNDKEGEEKLNIFASQIQNICKEKNVHCFEPSIKEDKYFYNIVHFNAKGHKKMASELKKYIEMNSL